VSNAIVRQVNLDKNTGRVYGVLFIDRHSHREMEVKAKVVVLAAGSLETTRLLLNSGAAPDGSGLRRLGGCFCA
jgi:choline dehydrogenase-like flavoprotein